VKPDSTASPLVQVEDLALRYGEHTVQHKLNFTVQRGEVLAIVGPSGCGKSTLMRHLVGLNVPAQGRVRYTLDDGPPTVDLNACSDSELATLQRRFGVLFQDGALWSAMSVGENLMLPLRLFSGLSEAESAHRARFKLAMVGLAGSFSQPPAALSGGMRKRAAIARALVLDPPLLYLDEPNAGLDPLSSARLDGLILDLQRHLGTTVVMVTHHIDSVFSLADRVLYLDPLELTMTALDTPQRLLTDGPPRVREFMQRNPHDRPAADVTIGAITP
jgi:phospholipid/cholesterol/gamma-HCH transport system ATP-binding protein